VLLRCFQTRRPGKSPGRHPIRFTRICYLVRQNTNQQVAVLSLCLKCLNKKVRSLATEE